MFGDLFPVVSSGTAQPRGAIYSLKFEVNGLEAEAERSSEQSQDVFQGARAFYGATTLNTLNQQEDLAQEASAVNEKFVTYEPGDLPEDTSLQKLTTALFASRFLARGGADNAQDQIGGQSAVSSGLDDGGNISTARNELLQEEDVEQVIEESTVRTQFDLRQLSARERRIDAIFDDHNAEAHLSNEQRQGYTTADPAQKGNTLFDNPTSQFASSDGSISQNNMVQDASSTQKSNTLIETFADFRKDSSSSDDSGDVEVAISLNGDFVDGENTARNRAITFVESIQKQALVQQAMAGFDEAGNVTGNGGVAMNNAIQTVSNSQIGQVKHLTNILV
jgi:hypothetical protein